MCLCSCLKTKWIKKETIKQNNYIADNRRTNKLHIDDKINSSSATFRFKDKLKCIFCGGKSCKHEDWKNHGNPAVTGLNSDLIDNVIFASQRPSTFLIKKFDLINIFKSKKIGLIVNLQREGEHPFCGPNDGLEESGFSYNPEQFIENGINVICSGWKDMSVPDSVAFVLRLVKEMHNVIVKNNEKVLVHCHAGYGRTGIIIACYYIYAYKVSAEVAVKVLRSYRSKCIQKANQFEFCKLFENYLVKCRCIFQAEPEELTVIMKNQRELASDQNENLISNTIPKIIYEVLDLLVIRINESGSFESNLVDYISKINGTEEINIDNEQHLYKIKQLLNKGDWNSIHELDNLQVISELLFDWMDDSVECLLSIDKIKSLGHRILSDLIAADKTNALNPNSSIRNWIVNTLIREFKLLFSKAQLEILLVIAFFISELKFMFLGKMNSPSKRYDKQKATYLNELNVLLERLCVSMIGQQKNQSLRADPVLLKSRLLEKPTLGAELKNFLTNLFSSNTLDQGIVDFLFFIISLLSSDMIEKRNELKMMKRNNLCLSTLYNKSEVFKGNQIKNSFDADQALKTLTLMKNDLDQLFSYQIFDLSFFDYFIEKYHDLFVQETAIRSLKSSFNSNLTPLFVSKESPGSFLLTQDTKKEVIEAENFNACLSPSHFNEVNPPNSSYAEKAYNLKEHSFSEVDKNKAKIENLSKVGCSSDCYSHRDYKLEQNLNNLGNENPLKSEVDPESNALSSNFHIIKKSPNQLLGYELTDFEKSNLKRKASEKTTANHRSSLFSIIDNKQSHDYSELSKNQSEINLMMRIQKNSKYKNLKLAFSFGNTIDGSSISFQKNI